jgi:hypothetical protein
MSRTSFLDGIRVVCGLTQQASKASLGSLEVSACLLDPTRGTRRATRCRVVHVGVMTTRRILGRAIHGRTSTKRNATAHAMTSAAPRCRIARDLALPVAGDVALHGDFGEGSMC